jgi:hypothetical protein
VPRPPNSSWSANGAENTNSTQPHVAYEDGQLSISASDSSLADVLYALRACTGADIDIPPGTSAERVTAQLGPGPARKVLADLLTWSSFDYVIQGSDTDPLSVQSVTLMIRVKSATASTSGAPAPAVNPRTAPMTSPRQIVEPSPAPVDVPEAENNKPDSPASAAADSPTPSASPAAQPRVPDMSPGGVGSSAGKSPADMIQELQQMYQQRRALQEQQNRGAAPAPAPGSSR